jgi:hypothetical protein
MLKELTLEGINIPSLQAQYLTFASYYVHTYLRQWIVSNIMMLWCWMLTTLLWGAAFFVCFNCSNLDEATHCFVELSKTTLPVDLSVLVKKRIPCVPPLYLNDYLIKTPPPQAHNCVVPEYKEHLQAQ